MARSTPGDVGEVGVVLHFSKHLRRRGYSSARVATRFEAFVDGLLFKSLFKPSFDFFAVRLSFSDLFLIILQIGCPINVDIGYRRVEARPTPCDPI